MGTGFKLQDQSHWKEEKNKNGKNNRTHSESTPEEKEFTLDDITFDEETAETVETMPNREKLEEIQKEGDEFIERNLSTVGKLARKRFEQTLLMDEYPAFTEGCKAKIKSIDRTLNQLYTAKGFNRVPARVTLAQATVTAIAQKVESLDCDKIRNAVKGYLFPQLEAWGVIVHAEDGSRLLGKKWKLGEEFQGHDFADTAFESLKELVSELREKEREALLANLQRWDDEIKEKWGEPLDPFQLMDDACPEGGLRLYLPEAKTTEEDKHSGKTYTKKLPGGWLYVEVRHGKKGPQLLLAGAEGPIMHRSKTCHNVIARQRWLRPADLRSKDGYLDLSGIRSQEQRSEMWFFDQILRRALDNEREKQEKAERQKALEEQERLEKAQAEDEWKTLSDMATISQEQFFFEESDFNEKVYGPAKIAIRWPYDVFEERMFKNGKLVGFRKRPHVMGLLERDEQGNKFRIDLEASPERLRNFWKAHDDFVPCDRDFLGEGMGKLGVILREYRKHLEKQLKAQAEAPAKNQHATESGEAARSAEADEVPGTPDDNTEDAASPKPATKKATKKTTAKKAAKKKTTKKTT